MASPSDRHAWPNVAACWSPRMPAIGTPASAPRSRTLPYSSDDERISGSIDSGMPMSSAIDASHRQCRQIHQQGAGRVGRVRDVHAAVRAAGHVPQQPGVHVAEQQLAGLGPLARALDVVEDPADLRAREVRRERQAGLRLVPVLPAAQRLQLGADPVGPACPARRSRCTPACRWTCSHTTAVSRWLVMPTATMSFACRSALASAPAATSRVLRQISSGSCSTQPAFGKICSCSFWSTDTTSPAWLKIMQRVDVVPWSIAAT